MKVGDKIFAYGTLRPGFRANSILVGKAEHHGTTRINGKLYDVASGGFPGVKLTHASPIPGEAIPFLSEEPTVEGDLYEIKDQRLIERLDSYEGYPTLYDRRRVVTENGLETWVYTFVPVVDEDQRIPSGKWK